MLARDGDVVEEHVALGRAADQRALGGREEALPRPAAAGADDERRALAREIVQRRRRIVGDVLGRVASSSARPPRPCSASSRSASRSWPPPDSGTRTPGSRRGSRALFARGRAPRREDVGELLDVDVGDALPFSRAVRSARRMSIRPCSMRRRKETSFSSSSSFSISALRSSSESVARSGSASMAPFLYQRSREVLVSKAAGAPRGQPQLEASTEVRGAAASPCMISSTSSRTSCSSSSEACRRVALGVQVHERLVRIGQHLRPAALVEQLDPVGQVDVPAGETLVQNAHDETLLRPRAGEPAVDQASARAARRPAPKAAGRAARAARAAWRGSRRRRRRAGSPGRRSRRRRLPRRRRPARPPPSSGR